MSVEGEPAGEPINEGASFDMPEGTIFSREEILRRLAQFSEDDPTFIDLSDEEKAARIARTIVSMGYGENSRDSIHSKELIALGTAKVLSVLQGEDSNS